MNKRLIKTAKLNVFLLIFYLFLSIHTSYAATKQHNTTFLNKNDDYSNDLKITRSETDLFFEDFELNAVGWTAFDANNITPGWHPSATGALDGNSWWIGNEDKDGYLDHWYLVLDMPAVTVPTSGNQTFTFKMSYKTEDPSNNDGYDAWDGLNVRLSTDSGQSFSVISPTTPAYNKNSFFSFGYIFGEGENIPAWGGGDGSWNDVSFDLSSYAGQNVVLRIAFSSDDGFCVEDDASLFGVRIDSLDICGLYSNDGNEDEQITHSSLYAGKYWQIKSGVSNAPSGTKVLGNYSVQNNSYRIGLEDYYETPAIDLPEGKLIYYDFMVRGSISDPDEFPDVDYWGFEVSTDLGITWNAISNPSGDENGSNIVYSDLPADWASFAEIFGTSNNVSILRGNTVKFRFYFHSDFDTPSGEGLFIDNFRVWSEVYIPSPEKLKALTGYNDMNLTWIYGKDYDGSNFIPDNFYLYRSIDDAPFASTPYAIINGSELTYWDNKASNGHDYYYTITSFSTLGESDISNIVYGNPGEIIKEDGSIETGILMGEKTKIAIKFIPDSTANYVNRIRFYSNSKDNGQVILKAWNDNNNKPDVETYTNTLDTSPGWNTIYIEDSTAIRCTIDGIWMGIEELTNSTPLGIDIDTTPENTMLYTESQGWLNFSELAISGTPVFRLTFQGDSIICQIDEIPSIPGAFILKQNYPNPFNPQTSIPFTLSESGNVSLKLYSLTGQLVANLANRTWMKAGSHSILFNGKLLSSGIYIYRLEFNNKSISKKCILLK